MEYPVPDPLDVEQGFIGGRKITVHTLPDGTIVADGPDGQIDSGTDAKTVIQSALDEAEGFNGVVHIPNDELFVIGNLATSKLELGDGTFFKIDGTLKVEGGQDTQRMIKNKDYSGGNSHIHVFGQGEIDGNGENATDYDRGVIRFCSETSEGMEHIRIEGLYFHHCPGDPIRIMCSTAFGSQDPADRVRFFVVKNNLIMYCGNIWNAYGISDGMHVEGQYGLVEGNIIYGFNDLGVAVDNSEYCSMVDNIIATPDGGGIGSSCAYGTNHCAFQGNVISGGGMSEGIGVGDWGGDTPYRNLFEGNMIQTTAVQFNLADHGLSEKEYIKDNWLIGGDYGIHVGTDATDIYSAGNVLHDNATNAILYESGATAGVLRNNIWTGTGAGFAINNDAKKVGNTPRIYDLDEVITGVAAGGTALSSAISGASLGDDIEVRVTPNADPGADIAFDGRVFWDDSAGALKVQVEETVGSSSGDVHVLAKVME